MLKGIDVYNGNGVVDWPKVKAAGYGFAMIKASQGHTVRDASMARNLAGAAKAGLHTGVYHWIHAETEAAVIKEVDFFLGIVKGCKMEFPVALDVEQYTLLRLSKEKLTDIVLSWCDKVKAAGYYVVIYANLNVLRNHLVWERIKQYDIWLAQYNATMTKQFPVAIWQHSETGRVPGVRGGTGPVDLDICYKDYPSIIRMGGYNNFPKPVQPTFPTITGLTLDTQSRNMAPGDIYEVLAYCSTIPAVKITGRDIISVERIKSDPRGYKIVVRALKAGFAHIDVTAGSVTKTCNFNVK